MAVLPINKQPGFTLIEVLISLIIASLILSSVLTLGMNLTHSAIATEQHIKANWLSEDIQSMLQTNLIKMPACPDSLQGNSDILGDLLYWRINCITENKYYQHIIINIRNNHQHPISDLEFFLHDAR